MELREKIACAIADNCSSDIERFIVRSRRLRIADAILALPELQDREEMRERVAELEQQLLMVLAAVYAEAPRFVATICDEKLDRSGALLSKVRKLSSAALTQARRANEEGGEG